MQRITRDSSVHAPELLTTLDDKVRLLQRYFPPSVASLFATPRQGEDGTLQWWSGLGGQPLPYNQLDAGGGQALLARYEQRQAAIAQLIEAVRPVEKAKNAERQLIGPKGSIPAEDVLKRGSMLEGSRDDPLVSRGRDAGESVIACLQFPKQEEQRILVRYHSSLR